MTESHEPDRSPAEWAYYWALIASDMRDNNRIEARQIVNRDPEAATKWQRWAAGVPLDTTRQDAVELALMWARVAEVQEDPQ
ncbi:hypothetical protein ACFU98_44360 [Streptomyces sp. NPDC057575]|uniref:hypothetical protein n=1 Tax=unclassified Streptomyces TaxID=2593676 RepID=UPI003678A4BF